MLVCQMVSKADAVDHHEYLNTGLPTWHAQAGPHPAPWASYQCCRDLRWTPAQEKILGVASTFKLKVDELSASQVLQVTALPNPALCHLKSGDS